MFFVVFVTLCCTKLYQIRRCRIISTLFTTLINQLCSESQKDQSASHEDKFKIIFISETSGTQRQTLKPESSKSEENFFSFYLQPQVEDYIRTMGNLLSVIAQENLFLNTHNNSISYSK